MNLLLSRACIHAALFIVFCAIAFALPCSEWRQGVLTIISVFALINVFGEIAFALFTNGKDKSSLSKILLIRSIKFLCYLILTLPLIGVGNIFQGDNKLLFGLVIVGLFFIYTIVEFTFFKMRK